MSTFSGPVTTADITAFATAKHTAFVIAEHIAYGKTDVPAK